VDGSGRLNKNAINDNFEIKTQTIYLLFMQLFYNLLLKGGQAAIIVIEGALSGSSNRHKKIRQFILENCRLDAVISMPSGIFKPYAGVAASVLIFTKGEKTEEVWFYMMKNDGYTLDDRRTKIKENDIPDILDKFKTREISSKSWRVSIDEIKENDWNLSAARYRPYLSEEIKYPNPLELFDKLSKLEDEIQIDLRKFKEML
jgi:type I restriction enzyme M protein